MPGDSFGTMFRVTNWGESHGPALGAVVEGCPPGLPLEEAEIQAELNRRAPGQSDLTTTRRELDRVEILSGVYKGKTTGTPISLLIRNVDQRSVDYLDIAPVFRPSHADFTYEAKYRIRDPRGGGRSSARLTAGHVAAGAVAKKILLVEHGVEILAYVAQMHRLIAQIDPLAVTHSAVEATAVRCPDAAIAEQMASLIRETRDQGDSLGGIITCVAKNIPAGLGEPLFDRLDADLAKAMLAINATKGFEIGEGFGAVTLLGSQHNDEFCSKNGEIATTSNRSGGIQGGISNGMPIVFRVAFKPTATIAKPQKTVTRSGEATVLEAKGRHDPCVLPRAVPIVEAMTALVLCDHYLRWRGQCGSSK